MVSSSSPSAAYEHIVGGFSAAFAVASIPAFSQQSGWDSLMVRPGERWKHRMQSRVAEHGLDGVEIFRDLEPAERARLAAELETLNLRRGDVLVRQGEMADALYVVVTGRFAVTLDGRRDLVAEVGPGQPIGEIAFLAGGVRTATVTALRDSLVLRLGRAEFEALSAKSPSIWRTLTVTLARRVAEANVSRAPPPDPRPRTVALIRAGASELPAMLRRSASSRASAPATDRCWYGAETASDVLPAGTPLDSAEATRALNALEGALRLRAVSSPSTS